MAERVVSEELIRDLVQCVQAARDGAEAGSLFAMQCDLVLAQAAHEVRGILMRRAVEQAPPPPPVVFDGRGTYALHVELESQ